MQKDRAAAREGGEKSRVVDYLREEVGERMLERFEVSDLHQIEYAELNSAYLLHIGSETTPKQDPRSLILLRSSYKAVINRRERERDHHGRHERYAFSSRYTTVDQGFSELMRIAVRYIRKDTMARSRLRL